MVSLRLLFISALLVLAVVAASASMASAEKVVLIKSISSANEDDAVVVVVNLKSQHKVTDGKVTVAIPELGSRARSNVDFSKNSEKAVHLLLQDNLPADQYARVVFSSDHGRRVKYRQVLIG